MDHYMQRHRVKPGITGWAQVNGLRGETDTLQKMAKRVRYDLFYLQNWSLVFDLRIIAMKRMLPMQPGDVYATYADIDRTLLDHGFAPRTNLATGLERFARWYRDFHHLDYPRSSDAALQRL